MSKRAKIMLAATLLGLAGCVLALVLWPRPSYQGKSVSWWLRQAPADWDLNGQAAQREALRSFGPVALPDLLAAVAGRTDWRGEAERIDEWLYQTSHQHVRLLNHPDRQPNLRRQFELLSELAEPAVADLLAMTQDNDAQVVGRALDALAAIGTTNALSAVAPLLNSTNAALRSAAAYALASFGPRAHDLAPALMRQATDPDPAAARCALFALGSVATEVGPLLPVFTNALTSGDAWKQHFALQRLRSWGSATAPAVPAISNLLQSSSPASALHRQLLASLQRLHCEMRDGAIVRGPRDRKQIALLFTGHEFAEGGDAILTALARHQAKASFFVTGSFLTNTTLAPLCRRMLLEGHYHFIHSDQHLLYCSWEHPPRTLVSRWDFEMDVKRNHAKLALERRSTLAHESQDYRQPFFVPPYEHWNPELAYWARALGYELIGYTPGTRANADYTEDDAPNFVSSQAIFDSILARERADPDGLNGFLLLLHLGAGPKRTDKFHARFDELLTVLSARGYQFVRVDELLNGPPPAP